MSNYKFTALTKVEPKKVIRKFFLISLIIISILFAMLFLPWEQTVKGQGQVIALEPTERDYSVLAPVDGFIEKFYVKESQFVKQGDPLFKMVDLDSEYLLNLKKVKADLEYQVRNIKSEESNLNNQVAQTEEYLENGLTVFDKKVFQIQQKIESLEFQKKSFNKNLEIEKSHFNRIKSLYEDGIESKRNFDLSKNSFFKADADFNKILVDIKVEKQNILIAEKEKKQFQNQTLNKLNSLKNQILNVLNKEKNLIQQIQNQSIVIERYKNSEMVAPKDGYVVRLFKNDKNRYIKKGDEVLHFAPKVTEKAILLKVVDFNMPLIKENLPVRTMFYGWPALQISGWPKIRFGSFGGKIEKVEYVSHEKGFYYAYVTETPEEPWPKGEDLRIGTQATVWVRLSTVPIWYQIWRFMNAFPPKMVTPEKERF